MIFAAGASAQENGEQKAEAIVAKAVRNLGGDRYLNVKTLYATGRYSIIRDGAVLSYQTFTDIIVYPDKERTDFKFGGVKNSQANFGDSGWIFDGAAGVINVATEKQVKDFKRSLSVSLDHLLRGHWRGKANLTYIGRREATLGKRNDVIKLEYSDGLVVEFEFSDAGIPVKAIYATANPDGEDSKEEDRYAQFIETDGIKAPYIIDHFSGGSQTSRINYLKIEYNKNIPDSVFAKPTDIKEAKKDIKF